MYHTRQWKYVRRTGEIDELYHLATDRAEQLNLAQDPGCAAIRAEMADRMLTWLTGTADVVPRRGNLRVRAENSPLKSVDPRMWDKTSLSEYEWRIPSFWIGETNENSP